MVEVLRVEPVPILWQVKTVRLNVIYAFKHVLLDKSLITQKLLNFLLKNDENKGGDTKYLAI
jgi:hypothetical protein